MIKKGLTMGRATTFPSKGNLTTQQASTDQELEVALLPTYQDRYSLISFASHFYHRHLPTMGHRVECSPTQWTLVKHFTITSQLLSSHRCQIWGSQAIPLVASQGITPGAYPILPSSTDFFISDLIFGQYPAHSYQN